MSSRPWKRAVLLGIVLCSAYVLGLSIWSRAAGEAYRQRELARDQRYHEAVESRDPTIRSLSDQLVRESEQDFTGEDAMKIGAAGFAVLLAGYTLGAGLWLRRARG